MTLIVIWKAAGTKKVEDMHRVATQIAAVGRSWRGSTRFQDLSYYQSILYPVPLLIVGVVLTLLTVVPREAKIAAREQIATGHFTAHVGQGRSSAVYYGFSVDGVAYERRARCMDWMHSCPIGGEIAVYYDPLNLSQSSIVEYGRDRARGITICSICIAASLGLVGLYFLLVIRRGRLVVSGDPA